jgi:hypothetical protein
MRDAGRRHAARFDRTALARRHLALYDAVRAGGRLPPEGTRD